MLEFLHNLLQTGRVVVPFAALVDEDLSGVHAAIRSIDADARLEAPLEPPPLSLPVAVWALGLIENACRFLVYRELDGEVIEYVMREPCPEAVPLERIYSADLFLRYIPDITRMARGMGPADPLVKALQSIAADWPLSSVGMVDLVCEPVAVTLILSHPSLGQLYVDRIIEHADLSRLTSSPVCDAVAVSIGAHSCLAPMVMKAIQSFQEQACQKK